MGFNVVLDFGVCQIRAADSPKAIYGGRISPFHSWSFERMILKPHTSYPVRQIKRPFFLASSPPRTDVRMCSWLTSRIPRTSVHLARLQRQPRKGKLQFLWAEFVHHL